MGEQTIEYFYNRIILSIKGMNYTTWMNLKIVTLTERRQTNKQIKSTYVCFKMDKIPGKTNEFIVTKLISDALGGGGRKGLQKCHGETVTEIDNSLF